MARILANDGIHPTGKRLLEEAGHEVSTDKIAQEDLVEKLGAFDAIIVRSATKVRTDLIDACPNLKVIARAGVGTDNIDVSYAESKGIRVVNTPAASSRSVAELVIAHILTISRSLHIMNREMPNSGSSDFKALKKSCSNDGELLGKTLGIVGFGRIGQELAKIAIGMGMRVQTSDPFVSDASVSIQINDTTLEVKIENRSIDALLESSDFISLHVPFSGGKPLVDRDAIAKIKTGAIVVNASRGGVIDEDGLLEAVQSQKLKGAALDVFVGEPKPREDLLQEKNLSFSPHIGASTLEAQENIGKELAKKLNALL